MLSQRERQPTSWLETPCPLLSGALDQVWQSGRPRSRRPAAASRAPPQRSTMAARAQVAACGKKYNGRMSCLQRLVCTTVCTKFCGILPLLKDYCASRAGTDATPIHCTRGGRHPRRFVQYSTPRRRRRARAAHTRTRYGLRRASLPSRCPRCGGRFPPAPPPPAAAPPPPLTPPRGRAGGRRQRTWGQLPLLPNSQRPRLEWAHAQARPDRALNKPPSATCMTAPSSP